MGFLGAFRYIQKNVFDYTLDTKRYGVELARAIINARQFNDIITEQDLRAEAGKKRQLKINIIPPICDDDGECTDTVCGAGTVVQPMQEYFDISQCTASAVYQLNKDDIRLIDGEYSFSQYAMSMIRAALPTVREKLASEMAALLVANVGLLPNGNTEQLLPVIDKTNGVVNPMGMWQIQRAYYDSGYTNPFIVGGSDVFFWQQAVGVGGLNAQGQYINQLNVQNLYYDPIINDTFGDTTTEHVISFDPKMLKFVSFNRNAGIFATDRMSIEDLDALYQRGPTDYIHGVIADPLLGLLWDLDVKYDDCEKRWTFQWRLEWDIFFMSPRICNIQGLNSIFHWTTCVQLQPTCETGSPITGPTSSTFAAETSGEITFPAIVQKLQIGNTVVFPPYGEGDVANITALKNLLNASQGGIVFSVSGTELRYTGYSGITVTINDTIDLVFS